MKLSIFAAAAAFAIAPFAAQAVTAVSYAAGAFTDPLLIHDGDSLPGITIPDVNDKGTNVTPVPIAGLSGALGKGAGNAEGFGWAAFKFEYVGDPGEVFSATTRNFNDERAAFIGVQTAFVNLAGLDEVKSGKKLSLVTAANIVSGGGGAVTPGILDGAGELNGALDVTVDMAALGTAWLVTTWDNTTTRAGNVTLNVSTIPLPAGFVLFGTAFALAGAARRFGRKAA